MGAFQNIGLQDYFRRYGMKFALSRGIFLANPFHLVKDYENKKILYYRKIYPMVERTYFCARDTEPKGLVYGTAGCKNPIWMYWKQGLESAPAIVRQCVRSVQKYAEDPVILLSDRNMEKYVRFPAYVTEKMRCGKLSAAAYSDLLRLSLLERFGGTWIDATVYLTGPLPGYITKSPLFAFQDTFGLIENPARYSNWMLHAEKGDPVIRKTRNVAFEYWKRESYSIDYLISYLIFTIAAAETPEAAKQIPFASSVYTGLMLKELDQPYREETYRHITEMSSIHKLTYKLKGKVLETEGNLYQRIMQEKL